MQGKVLIGLVLAMLLAFTGSATAKPWERHCDDEGNCAPPPGTPTPPPPPAEPPPPPPAEPPPPPSDPYAGYPDFDPNYVEGAESDWSTVGYYNSVFATSTTGPTGCAQAQVSVTRENSVTKVWRAVQVVYWCYAGGQITEIRNRRAEGFILTPTVSRYIYPWRWESLVDNQPRTGVSESVSYSRLRFEMCAVFRIGPLCHIHEPWTEITITARGTATCNTSAGRVRNCWEER